jgi:hypothetical protein
MAKDRSVERELWLLVLGGMMAHPSVLKEALSMLESEDAPMHDLGVLFLACKSGDAKQVHTTLENHWKVENGATGTAIQSVLKKVKWLAQKHIASRQGEALHTMSHAVELDEWVGHLEAFLADARKRL